MLTELYWFVQVIEAGSFSAAAERTGVAKSNLSRRLIQLEGRLNVQLLNRSTRLFALTGVGEQVYRHALDMLAASQAAQDSAEAAVGRPSGLVRLSAPSVLAGWLMALLARFSSVYPQVSFSLSTQDAQIDLASQRLDLSLSLDTVPRNSTVIVARALARLPRVIVASPDVLSRMGKTKRLGDVDDSQLMTLGSPQALQPWPLIEGNRVIHTPAFCAQSLLSLKQAAKAGLGLACLPLSICTDELAAGTLQVSDLQDIPLPSTLYALTSPHKGISQTTRLLIQFIRDDLTHQRREGVSSLGE